MEFTYSLKCICNTKINTHGTFKVSRRCIYSSEISESPDIQIIGKQGGVLPSCFNSCPANKCLFGGICSAMSPIFLCFFFFLVISPFKMAPKCRNKVLSTLPQYQKAMICFTKKIHVFHKLSSGMSYNAIGCKFNVYEPTVYIK